MYQPEGRYMASDRDARFQTFLDGFSAKAEHIGEGTLEREAKLLRLLIEHDVSPGEL